MAYDGIARENPITNDLPLFDINHVEVLLVTPATPFGGEPTPGIGTPVG